MDTKEMLFLSCFLILPGLKDIRISCFTIFDAKGTPFAKIWNFESPEKKLKFLKHTLLDVFLPKKWGLFSDIFWFEVSEASY